MAYDELLDNLQALFGVLNGGDGKPQTQTAIAMVLAEGDNNRLRTANAWLTEWFNPRWEQAKADHGRALAEYETAEQERTQRILAMEVWWPNAPERMPEERRGDCVLATGHEHLKAGRETRVVPVTTSPTPPTPPQMTWAEFQLFVAQDPPRNPHWQFDVSASIKQRQIAEMEKLTGGGMSAKAAAEEVSRQFDGQGYSISWLRKFKNAKPR